MDIKEWKITKYAGYQEKINLELFQGLLMMIVNLSESKDAMRYLNGLERWVVWWDKKGNDNQFLQGYGYRYPGEVLERYGESFGEKRENLRALALALGYAAPLLEGSMFVGQQKEAFLRKVKKEAENDVYLLGALYLLEPRIEKQKEMLEQLAGESPKSTEEAVFVLSLYQNPEDGFEKMQTWLFPLWGKKRTISLLRNIGILEWLITVYQPVIKKSRRRETYVLKALMKLPYTYAKEDSKVFQTLHSAGYDRMEIVFANSYMVLTDRIYDGPQKEGITAEKIAAECCITFLNHKEELELELYDYLAMLFEKYAEFSVKYQGNEGIWNAVSTQIHPSNPKTVLWMIENLKEAGRFPYCFDVYDAKWDVLSDNLDSRKYCELFAYQMTRKKDITLEDLQKRLVRYQQLTGREFLQEFHEYWEGAESSFNLLVEYNIICLWNYFEAYKDEPKERGETPKELQLLWDYVKNVKNRKAFCFVQQFINVYGLARICHFFGCWKKFHGAYVSGLGQYHREDARINIKRIFLSEDEQRQLFSWIDESVFREEPEYYYRFVKAALNNETVRAIYPKEELKEAYQVMVKYSILTSWEAKELGKYYLTPEEILERETAEETKRVEEERKRKEEELEKMKACLKDTYDGSFASLKEYLKKYYWENEKKKAMPYVFKQLAELVKSSVKICTAKEFCDFLYLCEEIIHFNMFPQEQIVQMIEKMIRSGYYVTNV